MRAQTAKFEEMILEVEFDPSGTPDEFTNICGITDVTINRTSNIDTSEIPDCDDESLPLSIERQVRSQEVTVSGTGVWAAGSNQKMMTWWRSGTTLKARLRNAYVENNGAAEDIYAEVGPALLASINNSRIKGQKVTSEIELQFDGVPTTEALPVA